MAEMKVYPDMMIACPLLDKNIPETMCYDINLVVDGVAAQCFVPEVANWTKAKITCPHCPVSYYKDVREYQNDFDANKELITA